MQLEQLQRFWTRFAAKPVSLVSGSFARLVEILKKGKAKPRWLDRCSESRPFLLRWHLMVV